MTILTKSPLLIFASLCILFKDLVQSTHGDRYDLFIDSNKSNTNNVTVMTQPCLLFQKSSLVKDSMTGALSAGESTWHCEASTEDQTAYGTQSMLSIDGLSNGFFEDVGAVSGVTTFFSSSASMEKDKVKFDRNHQPLIGKKRGKGGRRLATTIGTHTVLVVRVIALDASMTSNATDLSDKIFGTYGDSLNLRSGYDACSFGQLKMVPTRHSKATNGVLTLSIPTKAVGVDVSVIENAAWTSLTSMLGDPSTQFDHIMLCLPPGTLAWNQPDWVAYGYVNSYLTVFNNDACLYPSVQIHEIGHNMNVGHSGQGTNNEYGDRTCLMGYSYMYDTESPHMCFNGAKSFNLGWYSSRVQTLNVLSPSSFSPSTFTLMGVTDYGANVSGSTLVVLKLEAGSIDYYVSFNRKTGINSETQMCPNRVMITSQGDSPSVSYIVGDLSSSGQSITLAGIYNITITVNSIDVTRSPGIAVITVSRSTGSSTFTRRPTRKPTRRPSNKNIKIPSRRPTRSPSNKNIKAPSRRPTRKPTRGPSSKTIKTPTRKPTLSRLSQAPTGPFMIKQGWTCGNINSSKSLTSNTSQWYTGCQKICMSDSNCLGFFFQKNTQQNIQACTILYYNPKSLMTNTGNSSVNIFCGYKVT